MKKLDDKELQNIASGLAGLSHKTIVYMVDKCPMPDVYVPAEPHLVNEPYLTKDQRDAIIKLKNLPLEEQEAFLKAYFSK